MEPVKIIAIAGTDGSGKDSLGEFLRDAYGWYFISVTDLLRQEANKRGIKLSRLVLRQISSEWRGQHGLGVLVDKAAAAYAPLAKGYKGLVVASLRNPGEVDSVHKLGGKVVWLDAPIRLRYQRAVSRNKGTEDQITFEEFQAEEQAQMHQSGDETTLSLSAVKAKADIFITNDSSNFEEFKQTAKQALKDLV